jgi:hypothetical protein
MMTGLNITVTIYHRQNNSDDKIGGADEYLSVYRTQIPSRIVAKSTPWVLKSQGIVTEQMYSCVVQSPDYIQIDVHRDDVLVPESGQYQGVQLLVMEVEETSLDDNPVDYRGVHRGLTLKKLTPNLKVL